jgi:hypothetical protein
MAGRQIAIRVNAKTLAAAIKKTQKQLSRAHVKVELKKIADKAKAEAVTKTPKRFTGNTKKGWKVVSGRGVAWIVKNDYRAMRYLETGTKEHGPKRANLMFIPLNKRARNAGPRGVFRNRKNFKFGKDYILSKRVRGITAHYIIRDTAITYSEVTERTFDRLVATSIR